jgi:uncharacterized protein (TIGR03118 family)
MQPTTVSRVHACTSRRSRTVLAGIGCLGLFLIFQTSAEAQYRLKNLVTYGTGPHQDPLLVDPWGIGFRCGGPFFVANVGTGVVTMYDARGRKGPHVIHVPPGAGLPAWTLGTPGALVANNSPEFVISKNGKSAPALFIVSTFDGTISGWNPEVDPDNAVMMVDYSAKEPDAASFTGLELARNKHGKLMLYAADSGTRDKERVIHSNNEIDVFDGHFQLVNHFGDPKAPLNMTVLNVQHVSRRLFVTYAAFDRFVGGYIDIFDTEGQLLDFFAANSASGPLQNPFSVVLAPEDFGEFSGKLLIGNQDDGHINAYDPDTYQFLGPLRQDGKPIAINANGMAGMTFGGGTKKNGRTNQLFFCRRRQLCSKQPSHSLVWINRSDAPLWRPRRRRSWR